MKTILNTIVINMHFQNLDLPLYLESACHMENSSYSHKFNESHDNNNDKIQRKEIEE